MRKMLILLAVLFVASAANASMLSFHVVDEYAPGELEANTTYTVQVIFDDTNPGNDTGYQVAIGITGYASFSVGTLHTALDESGSNVGNKYDPANTGVSIGPVIAASNAAGPYMVDDMVTYSFSVTTGSIGSVLTIDDVSAASGFPPWGGAPIGFKTLLNGITQIDVAAVEYDIVPEPMTIALLGLGGLFLRRRK